MSWPTEYTLDIMRALITEWITEEDTTDPLKDVDLLDLLRQRDIECQLQHVSQARREAGFDAGRYGRSVTRKQIDLREKRRKERVRYAR